MLLSVSSLKIDPYTAKTATIEILLELIHVDFPYGAFPLKVTLLSMLHTDEYRS